MKFLEQLNADATGHLVVLFFIFIAAIFIRYLFFSYAYHYTFFVIFRKALKNKFLHQKKLKVKQLKQEVYWSMITCVIFAGFGLMVYALIYHDYSFIYHHLSVHDIWYIPLSIFIFLFAQDTYYYWIHRWMHLPKVYRFIHLTHHKSVHTSAFTSFSFHPIESLLQAIFFPVIICVLPMHLYAFLGTLGIMSLSATINHAGIEIYPNNHFGQWLQKHIIGASHHNVHHTKFNYNYGLYFTFWDRWMNTEKEVFKNKKN